MLEQWPALEVYFKQSANISTALKNPIFKLHYIFFKVLYSRSLLASIRNTKYSFFHQLFVNHTQSIHKAFLSSYLSANYVYVQQPLYKISPASQAHLLPLTSMNMGQEVSNFLGRLSRGKALVDLGKILCSPRENLKKFGSGGGRCSPTLYLCIYCARFRRNPLPNVSPA